MDMDMFDGSDRIHDVKEWSMTKTIFYVMCLCTHIKRLLCAVIDVKTMNLGQNWSTRRNATFNPEVSVVVQNRLELICETIKRQPLLIRPVKYERLLHVTQRNILYTNTRIMRQVKKSTSLFFLQPRPWSLDNVY